MRTVEPISILDFLATLRAHGITCGAGVPCSVFKPVVNAMTVDPELDYIAAASEGEAVAVAAGLIAGGQPAFALMQNSGLGNAVNPVTSLLHIYQIPAVLLVSHRGEPGRPDEPQHQLMGEIVGELARLIGLRTHTLEPGTFEAQLAAALEDGVPSAWICRRGALTGGPAAPPVRLEVRGGPGSGASGSGDTKTYRPRVRREQALEALLPLLNRGLERGAAPAVISTTGKQSRELYELDDREHDRANRFYMVGSMGCAAGMGLGVARARPSRRVVVLDGDGAVLMKLGTLATIGQLGPENLHHVVVDNGAYESTGAQPSASPTVDLGAVALACGYRDARTADEPAAAAAALEEQLEGQGPSLLRIVVQVGSRGDLGRPRLAPRAGWLRFCGYLQGRGS
jgi:phosphonopyruvate decarboxylase